MTRIVTKLHRPRLRTARLHLEPLRARHADEVYVAVDESRARLRRWLPFVDQTHRAEDTRAFLRRIGRSQRGIVWGIWDEPEGPSRRAARRFCGTIGLHAISLEQSLGMIGYWMRTSCSGRGYMSEAAAAVLLWAFDELGLERVSIMVAPGNAASMRVMEKLGFVREGLLRSVQSVPSRRRRLDWVIGGLIRRDLRRTRRVLRELCGKARPWAT